jgi:hypothetical protein
MYRQNTKSLERQTSKNLEDHVATSIKGKSSGASKNNFFVRNNTNILPAYPVLERLTIKY